MSILAIAVVKLFKLITFLIIIRCLLTWFPGGTDNKIYDILTTLTYPIEEPVRSVLYKYMNGPIDISPLVTVFLLQIIERILLKILM
ncbi:YggT family protein [Romboutsia maritimum]|uniref:YggT family protein n=1 Tax=Romboutsia maritimum TaxID=2020948 RepID=A0A371IWR0_9FIRM|nr:YggT family protein [Romboutsia maritimum]RDY24914.1 YggT family protein [Romboutsia maritimum]